MINLVFTVSCSNLLQYTLVPNTPDVYILDGVRQLIAGDSFHYRAVINNTHVGGMRVGATAHHTEHLCGASVDTREILLTQCRRSIIHNRCKLFKQQYT